MTNPLSWLYSERRNAKDKVIDLHNIARYIENELDDHKLAKKIRKAADELAKRTKDLV